MSPVLEQRVFPGWDAASFSRWLPVMLGLAVMYVPTYIDLAQGLWKEGSRSRADYSRGGGMACLAHAPRSLAGRGNGRAAAGGVLLASGCCTTPSVARKAWLFEVGLISSWPGVCCCYGAAKHWPAVVSARVLFFLVPLPGFVIELVTGPLKILVTHVVHGAGYWLGYPIARSGSCSASAIPSPGRRRLRRTEFALQPHRAGFAVPLPHGVGQRARIAPAGVHRADRDRGEPGTRCWSLVPRHFPSWVTSGTKLPPRFAGMMLFCTALCCCSGSMPSSPASRVRPGQGLPS